MSRYRGTRPKLPARVPLSVVDVTLNANGSSVATLISGDKRALEIATRYVAYKKDDPREFTELEEILTKFPTGRPIGDDDRSRGWEPVSHFLGVSATLRVTIDDVTPRPFVIPAVCPEPEPAPEPGWTVAKALALLKEARP